MPQPEAIGMQHVSFELASFADAARYDEEEVAGSEEGERFVARWKALEHFGTGGVPLYPSGLLEMLRGS